MKNINKKLRLCVIGNAILLIVVTSMIVHFRDDKTKYLRLGPHNDLMLISVVIDNYTKYFLLVFFIIIIKVSDVFISEIAHPILGFNIYNPDKKRIKEFTKIELQFYGNSMYFIDAIRSVFLILVNISQIDIALWGVISSQIASIWTIRMLLNEKKFKPDYEEVDMYEVV